MCCCDTDGHLRWEVASAGHMRSILTSQIAQSRSGRKAITYLSGGFDAALQGMGHLAEILASDASPKSAPPGQVSEVSLSQFTGL